MTIARSYIIIRCVSSNGLEHGGVAQLARANGSYPLGRWFEPTRRYQWPVGQAVKTPPFHGGNTSSNLVRVTIFGSIAQLGEHLPYKQRVIGSSPIVPTKRKRQFSTGNCRFLLYFLRNLEESAVGFLAKTNY